MKHCRRIGVVFSTLLLLVAVLSLPAYGQVGMTITKAEVAQLGGNQSQYCIEGTATNVGNNYHVDLQILDQNGGLICTSQIVVTNGAGTWSKCFTCAGGGVKVNVCLTDDSGAMAKPTACAVEKLSKLTKKTPALSQLGMVSLVVLLMVAGFWVMRTRRVRLEVK